MSEKAFKEEAYARIRNKLLVFFRVKHRLYVEWQKCKEKGLAKLSRALIFLSLFPVYQNVSTSKTGVLSHVLGSMESHRKVVIHFLGIFILLDYFESKH